MQRIKRFFLMDDYGRPYWRGDTVRQRLTNTLMNGPLALVSVLVTFAAIDEIGRLLMPFADLLTKLIAGATLLGMAIFVLRLFLRRKELT